MKPLGAVLLAAGLLGMAALGEQPPRPEEPSRTCFFQMLDSMDRDFCRGDLEVIYPEVGDVGCMYVPKCHQYRRRISREWGSPRVRYPQAEKSKKYVLVLVDPDAPSRANPRSRFWRHWLVTDIPGADLRTGDIKGRVLTGHTSSMQCSPGDVPTCAPNICSDVGKRRCTSSTWEPTAPTARASSPAKSGCGRTSKPPPWSPASDYVRPTPPPRSGYHRYQLRLYEQPAQVAIALSPQEWVSLGAWAMESFVKQFRLGSPVASTQFLTKYYED